MSPGHLLGQTSPLHKTLLGAKLEARPIPVILPGKASCVKRLTDSPVGESVPNLQNTFTRTISFGFQRRPGHLGIIPIA